MITRYRRVMNEPHEWFDGSKDAVAPSTLFNIGEKNIPVTKKNSGDEPLILYEKTTLGTSDVVPNLLIQNVVTETKNLKAKIDEKDESYDLKSVVDGVSPESKTKVRRPCTRIRRRVFAKSMGHWSCEATSHKINVNPGSNPIKFQIEDCLPTINRISKRN